MANFGSLFKKNFIVWRRDRGCCCCQIGTSIFFGLIMVLLKVLIAPNEIEKADTFYLGKADEGKDMTFPSQLINPNITLKPELDPFLPAPEVLAASLKDCNYIPFGRSEKSAGGYVAIVNANDEMFGLLEEYFKKGANFQVKRFTKESDMNNYIQDDDYGKKMIKEETGSISNSICFAINFKDPKPDGNKWDYALQFNTTGNPEKIDLIDHNFPQEILFQQEDDNLRYGSRYFQNGPLLVQNLVDNLILRQATSSSSSKIVSRFIRMPTHSYIEKGLFKGTNDGQIDSYVIFPVLVIYLGLIYHMLKEKEHKITANMRNMGMSMMPHYFSWYTFYLLVLVFCDILWTIIVKLSFFSQSNIFAIFLLFLLPGLVLLSMSFLVSAFFTTAKPGVLSGIIMFFLLYAASIGKLTVNTPSEKIYNTFALSPFTGLAMAGSNMVLLESTNGFGFSWVHIGQTIQHFKYSTFIIICLVEAFVFLLLGLYIDQVWPSEIGVRKHPLFFLGFTKAEKKPKDTNSVGNESREGSQDLEFVDKKTAKDQTEDKYEKLSPILVEQLRDSSSVIRVENIQKVYPNGKVAVKNVSFDMFDNQIFVLLGHNGAGKTTTISMISGLLAQTQGKMTICGKDTLKEYDEVKKILGVCPQLNPIYENMTCAEHLELYGNIKLGGKRKVSKEEIIKILTDIDLLEKKDYPAGRLSGGQKRKLCIGIAFIGDSKVILLDEPTSGMDTYARRYLWEMIKKYKKDRIIILCTHYMDEADFLGDRFAIMSQGEVVVCGSSLFLKKKFGVGYDLTIVKENSNVPSDKIEQLVTSNVPSAIKTGDISMELKFRLSTEDSTLFEKLFQQIEDNKEQYGIQNFGVSLTTLEEVFLRAAQGETDKKEIQSQSDWNKPEEIKKEDNVAEVQGDDNFQLEDVRIKGTFRVFTMHFWALCLKRFIYFKRDYKGLCCEIIIPIIIITIGLSFTLIQFLKDPFVEEWNPKNLFEDKAEIYVNIQGNDALKDTSKKLYDSMAKTDNFGIEKTLEVSTLKDFQQQLFDNPGTERPFSYFINNIDSSSKNYQYSIFYNDTFTAGSIIASNMMNSAILKNAVGDNEAFIKITSKGLPRTQQSKSYEKTADGFIFVFNLALAFAFIPAGVALFIVKERENNAKHQQIVSGVSISAYWLSNLFIDYLKYSVPAIYCGLSLLIFGIDAFTEDGGYLAVWIILILYGFAVITFTYLTSYLFKSPSSAQVAAFVFNFFSGFVLMIVSFAFRLIKATKDITIWFPELIFRLSPTFALAWGMFEIPTTTIWYVIYSLEEVPGIWHFKYGITKDVFYLAVMPIVFMAIIFYIETKSHKVNLADDSAKQLIKEDAGDDDVQKERQEVHDNEDYAVKVQDFVKQYVMVSKKGGVCSGKLLSKKVAAKGISFGVKKGECFGLLGTNGAGKTTTFKALSGEITPTYGVTKICGKDLSTEMQNVRHLIGYCPQFDTLLDNLTSREHLELYCAIKGIPKNRREKIIQDSLEQLNLKQFEHVQAGTYSGGNKRKLSVAIALLGNPPVILLDEPSSGMDPEARRFMWSVIGKVSTEKKYSSVILTTHSMEEAEALSTKLAIMVEGNIECIGSVQHLKSKYGKGFEIEIKFDDADEEALQKISTICSGVSGNGKYNQEQILSCMDKLDLPALKKELHADGKLYNLVNLIKTEGSVSEKVWFSEAALYFTVKEFEKFMEQNLTSDLSLLESMNSFFRYKIPEGFKLSQIFGLLENNQKQLKIAQYSVKQATTEQIFLNFAKDNLHKEE